jgi:hypothetical protein
MMNPSLHRELVAEREMHLLRRAEDSMLLAQARAARGGGPLARRRSRRAVAPGPPPHRAITIRDAYPDDGPALGRLAALDSRELPRRPLLVAEVDGVLWAALSIPDGETIADPFRGTVGVLELLRARAAQLRAAADGDGDGLDRIGMLARLGRLRLAWSKLARVRPVLSGVLPRRD